LKPSLVIESPAKINLYLETGPLRKDGFHSLVSLLLAIPLSDRLEFSPLSRRIELEIESDFPVAGGKKNLVFRAADLLRKTYGRKEAGAGIFLKKNIPVGSGLGGGSGDVWAALTGLNRLWKLGLPAERLERLSSRISSDAPFFFHQPMAWVSGRGEKVRSVKWTFPYRYLLVAAPGFPLATKEVYAGLKNKLTRFPGINKIKSAIIGEGWENMCFNRLEEPAFRMRPELAVLKEKIRGSGASIALLSGSGSSLWGAFEKRTVIEKTSRSFPGAYRMDLIRQTLF